MLKLTPGMVHLRLRMANRPIDCCSKDPEQQVRSYSLKALAELAHRGDRLAGAVFQGRQACGSCFSSQLWFRRADAGQRQHAAQLGCVKIRHRA